MAIKNSLKISTLKDSIIGTFDSIIASLNVKLESNVPIVPGTGTKITFDSKGLITGSTSLDADDIPALDASKITTGTIDAARLPSYVDDIIEGTNIANFPDTGESGKIYIALDTNKTYRWSGSAYVYITSGAVDSVNGQTGIVSLDKSHVGLGNLSNIAQVTSVAGTAPIVSSGGTTPSISIAAATTSTAGSMSASDKSKLDGIAANANNYIHPTGDGNLHVPATSTTNNGKVLTAGATAGSLSWTALAISNISGLQTALDGKASTATVTTSSNGIMSASDKTKLDGIATGANNYVLPTATSTTLGGIELFSDTVQSTAANAVTTTASRTYGIQLNSSGQAVVNVPWSDTNTTYSAATTSNTGLMSATDKTKLDSLSTTSTSFSNYIGETSYTSGSTTLEINKEYILSEVNTNNKIVYLPANPITGSKVIIYMDRGLSTGLNITLDPNGLKINKAVQTLTLDTSEKVELIYANSTIGWQVF